MLVRWPGSMPQYAVGHLDLVGAIDAALPAGLYVAGGAYRGSASPTASAKPERSPIESSARS